MNAAKKQPRMLFNGNHALKTCERYCERGIRTHETYVRNTLALTVVPAVKQMSTLPIIVDPSHGTGRADLVVPMSKAALACGADGLLIEVHCRPERAWTDAGQTIDAAHFRSLMDELRPLGEFATAKCRPRGRRRRIAPVSADVA